MPELDCSYAGAVTIKSETRAHKVDTYQIPSKYLKAVSGTDEWEEIENVLASLQEKIGDASEEK